MSAETGDIRTYNLDFVRHKEGGNFRTNNVPGAIQVAEDSMDRLVRNDATNYRWLGKGYEEV
jgi:hypothetical protein